MTVTVGEGLGDGATGVSDELVTEDEAFAYPGLEVLTVTVALCPGKSPLTVTCAA